jgi:hypothetical protein
MGITKEIAQHFREVHFGENWTDSCLKDQLQDVNWKEATTQVHSLNSIAMLVYHMNYYVAAVLKVLQNEPLGAKDKDSFNLPSITSQEEWDCLLTKIWDDAEKCSALIEKFPEEKLFEDMVDKKYGSFYRNFQGIMEHLYYHLGQIALIKKIIRDKTYF